MVIKLNEAIEKLEAGQVVGVPTDTVYGFACLDFAIDNLFAKEAGIPRTQNNADITNSAKPQSIQ